ncbi:MAG: S28 family serine protease [Saprospiraceae bacterium]|nr:S28 family serine protease [Saprospiraceae bacterium]
MNKFSSLLVLLLFTVCSQAQDSSLEAELAVMEGLSFKKLNDLKGGSLYELKVRQPIDHNDATKGFFDQKVYLTHRGVENLTVIRTAGYNVGRNRISELSQILDANQLFVEHRYFGASMPDSLDYRYLNLKQATADLHRVRELFTELYTNKWISTGISKGGATTIFYRYFYPEDVDLSVPYVAPINRAYEEPRIYDFLDTVGTDECRKKLFDFQIQVLSKRDEILPLLKFYSRGANVEYKILSLEKAFEFAVLEYPFSFWQWGYSCEKIPGPDTDAEVLASYLLNVSGPSFFGDNDIRYYTSHYYQSATEMGYYGYETSPFEGYLKALPTDSNPMALFFPFEMNDPFDGQLLEEINQWLDTEADEFIYIYGAKDTWTASAVPPNDKVDAEWFIMEGKHHGNARIANMNEAELERLKNSLEKWLELDVED